MTLKKKNSRVKIILECTNCLTSKKNLRSTHFGISRYITVKNRKNTPSKLELLKYCPYCNTHTSHKQIK